MLVEKDYSVQIKQFKTRTMKRLFSKIVNLISCLFGKHKWIFKWGNYQTNKDVFECKYCGKKIEK